MTQRIWRITLSLLLFVMLPAQAIAGDADDYGIAMHGEPKYERSDKHLDYANAQAPEGGILRRAAVGSFDSLNPHAIKGEAAEGLNLIYDRLATRVWDEPFTLYPLIARHMDVGPDRQRLDIVLRKDARFQNGDAILAEDVKFSWQTLRENGRPNMRRIYDLVKSAEIKGERRITFKFKDDSNAETVMIVAMMPVLSKNWWQGRDFNASLGEMPVTSGPYKVTEFERGRRIVYERNQDYWAKDHLARIGHHNFDRIIYTYFRDKSVAFEAFKAGEVDIWREDDASRWARGYDFPAVKNGEVIKETFDNGRPGKVRALIYNTRRTPFDNRTVRKALSYAIDYDWINKNLFHGQYERITSYFPGSKLQARGKPDKAQLELLKPYKDKLPGAVFGDAYAPDKSGDSASMRANLRKADKLLKKAGWRVKDGKRMRNGKALKFEILLNAPKDEKVALNFKRHLKRLGIDVTLRRMDSAAFRGRLNDYDYDMVLYHWQNSLSPGTEQMLYWGCKAGKRQANFNFAGICHEAVEEIAKGMADVEDRDALLAHARALDRILTWQFYAIPLFYPPDDRIAYRRDIAQPGTTPLYGPVLETWWHAPDKRPDRN